MDFPEANCIGILKGNLELRASILYKFLETISKIFIKFAKN